MDFVLAIGLRLFTACLLGGIIGFEREHMHRPAGFRTHILVCAGSALVMLTSEFVFSRYQEITVLDPTRMGAQVISGIGFLGAGTIIREGFNVKGLTTAASLWAVSCVGLSAGAGFYLGAVIATLLIFITLIVLKKLGELMTKKGHYSSICVQINDLESGLQRVSDKFLEKGAIIRKREFIDYENGNGMTVRLLALIPNAETKMDIVRSLGNTDGVVKIYED